MTSLAGLVLVVLLLPASAAAIVRPSKRQNVQVVRTLAASSERMASKRAIAFVRSRPTHGVPVIRVNDRVRYQRITGLGAAMTDSSAWLLQTQLSPGVRARVMKRLFGRSANEIGLNYVRVPIGASDFTVSPVPYTYDDLPAGQTDPTLAHFSIAHDRRYIIPALKHVLQINPHVPILANTWTAPPWMKANAGYSDAGGKGALLPEDYAPFANYIVKFIQSYRASGIPIWAITPENEPNSRAQFPAMLLPPAQQANLIGSFLVPALRAARLHTRIYGWDGARVLSSPQYLLSSPAAHKLAGIAWHCYGGLDVMSQLHTIHPHVQQIVNECSQGIIPYSTAEVLISSLRNWATKVSFWNLALDPAGGPVEPPNYGCRGCRGIITISEKTHAASFGADYYQLGQVSRFVKHGASRIASDRLVSDYTDTATGHYGVTAGVDDVALLNRDGSRVLIAYNNGSRPQRFAVTWRGNSFTYKLPARAMVTFVWR